MCGDSYRKNMRPRWQTLVLALFLLLECNSVSGQQATCPNSPLDIVVVIDTSDLVDQNTLATEKEFMKELVSSMIDQDNRFSLVTYAASSLIQFYLDSYKSVDDIHMAIEYLWVSTGNAATAKAIEYTVANAFEASTGSRPNVPDIVIVTSYSSMSSQEISNINDMLQQNMIEMVLLGLDSSQYSSMPSIRRLPMLSNDTLKSDVTKVINILCQSHGVQKPWNDWSSCGVTCGPGTQRRYRECRKRHPDDQCDGKQLEERACMESTCTEPINGGWTYWNEWSSCSKSCGGGLQTRSRACSAPIPTNGGLRCPGDEIQKKNCSDWKCPDCSKVCGTGSQLSKTCDVCECTGTILNGKITGSANLPQDNVEVVLKSLPHRVLATSDESGAFTISDMCLDNTELLFRKEGYNDQFVQPVRIDNLHWSVDVNMKSLVKPVIVRQPISAVRLVGQNWTVCCKAEGRPKPTNIQWYKDDIPLTLSSNMMTFQSLSKSDEGQYSCVVETIAGVAKSSIAELRVIGNPDDACTKPLYKSHQLPTDCFASQFGQNVSVVDLGQCQRQKCVSNDFHNNYTCGPSESTYCCDEGANELVQIYCKGFSYTMKRVMSCQCQNCIMKTVISGQAFGKMENGTKVPFAYGYLYVNGKQAAVTNEQGYFRFEIPVDQNKAIVHFVDETFKRFLPSTKVIASQPDTSISVTISLPLKPNPVDFDSKHGISVNLGGSKEHPVAGGLTIPENAIFTKDGIPFNGQAKAVVHFMDPRNLDDLEASNGEFVYKTEDGTVAPMETFGMFHASVEDTSGNELRVKKKMSFTLDASLFNVSTGDDGNPELSLWDFDVNNGVWIEKTKMRFANSAPSTGRRRLLDTVLIGEFEQQEIAQIDLTIEKPVYDRVIIGYTNCDHSVPIYANRIVTHSVKPKRDACYVGVTIYEDLTYNKTAGPGTNVVAVTKDLNGPKFKGKDSKTTDVNGRVCLSVFCDSIVYIYAESKFDGSRLIASDKHDVPIWYMNEHAKNTKNSTEVEVKSNYLDGVFENGKTRYGPFVEYEDKAVCKSERTNTYKFQFAYYASNPTLTTTVNKNDYKSKLSWYPVSPDKPFAKSCFIKVAVQIDDQQVRFIANSYFYNTKKECLYGTYDVSPLFDLTSANRTYRAACIEFRCPGLNDDKGIISYDVQTLVDVFLPTKQTCTISYVVPSLNITQLTTSHGFRFVVDPQEDYGPKFGVYISNGRSDTVSSFCASGMDTGAVGTNMKPDVNPAVIYTCS
ncbi:hypothetical protein ACF0H5_015268 [Mactra antiquata]